MTVVYLDSLFLLNFLVNYLLLLAAARVGGEALHRLRFALAAAVGGLYACAIFLPGCAFLEHLLCKLAIALLMALVAYGGARRLLRLLLLFLALSCALGGGVLALGLLGSRAVGMKEGVLFPHVDLKLVLLSAAVCYAVFSLVFRKLAGGGRGRGQVVPVTVELMGRRVAFYALVDTGNSLTDPLSGQPVLVVEGARLLPLFPPGQVPGREELRSPADALERLSVGALRGRLRLLPYRAIGVDLGMLLCLKPDRVKVNGKDWGALLVAMAPDPVSQSGKHCALIGAV